MGIVYGIDLKLATNVQHSLGWDLLYLPDECGVAGVVQQNEGRLEGAAHRLGLAEQPVLLGLGLHLAELVGVHGGHLHHVGHQAADQQLLAPQLLAGGLEGAKVVRLLEAPHEEEGEEGLVGVLLEDPLVVVAD